MKKRFKTKNSLPPKQEPDISEQTTLTGSLLYPQTRVELSGNREALIDGCRGIVEYNETNIRLNTCDGELRFTGRNLQIACMSQTDMVIRGFILGMEYCK